MYKAQTHQACSPSTCKASINFVERTMHSADLITPPLHQEGWCHRTGTQSSIPVSDADFPYSFGQVSQGRNPGHMEMNGKILINMRAGFHLNLLALQLLISHLEPLTSSLVLSQPCVLQTEYSWVPAHYLEAAGADLRWGLSVLLSCRWQTVINEEHVHLTWMETDGEHKARGFHWTRSQHCVCSIFKLSNVLQTCRTFLQAPLANRAK